MPRPPLPADAVDRIPGAIFSRLAHRIAERGDDVFPLHVGDTWMEPFEGGRMEDLSVREHPGMHRYGETQGIPALVDAIVEKVRARNALPAERASVLVTAGATGALGAAIGMLAAPGEEVLIAAPFWPLIRGIAQAFRATPVEVPLYAHADDPDAAVAAVRAGLTPKSVALYVSTPSNPTGRVLSPRVLGALAELARREGLWLLSDEVYEDYVYRGEHVSIGRFAPERTLSVFSFSKAYGMAGNRTGYLVGPPEAVAQARKISTHTFYAAPTAGQLAALRALRGGEGWVERARALYRDAGDDAARSLGAPPPSGSCFLFLDVADRLDARGLEGFLEDCLDDGVVLTPGASCGTGFERHVRLCFTAAPPERVAEAVRRLAKRLGR
jgi:N-succinyldiaminopimelate aminotransferase